MKRFNAGERRLGTGGEPSLTGDEFQRVQEHRLLLDQAQDEVAVGSTIVAAPREVIEFSEVHQLI